MMAQANVTTTATPVLTHIISFFGKFRFSGLTHRPNQYGDNTHNHSDGESSRELPECGGYNEAFIMQHWARYNPRY